ncbi:helix-turn-helix domain-containing protein [Vagococcus vulneris]|uniref:Transcriptional regulator n=1 Tax=Vagococcus vulneris TaxID=1977869 RepID=A0A429ZR65_9ENTE|nr:helix-turn-helix transcriptional regulator [Vagococcus vulneris]RST96139.1 transcriptional regulator [Vagococcus vulneris]
MLFDRVKELSEKRGKNVKEVALELGFSENYFYSWKKSSPKADMLQKVADYFDVSVDYLLGREDSSSLAEQYGAFAFDGEPVTDEEMEFLLSVLKAKRATDNK